VIATSASQLDTSFQGHSTKLTCRELCTVISRSGVQYIPIRYLVRTGTKVLQQERHQMIPSLLANYGVNNLD
jgi:hypothetical protein